MSQKLESLDDFKLHHYALIDLIDDTESMLKEQDILNGHDDKMAKLSTRIKWLIVVCDSSSEFGPRKIPSRRLVHLGRNLFTVNERIGSLSGGPDDVCLLRQYEEQLCDLKVELVDICSNRLSLGIEESDQLYTSQTQLDKELSALLKSRGCYSRLVKPLTQLYPHSIARELGCPNWIYLSLMGTS